MKMKFNTPIKKAILILLLCTIGLTEQSDKKFEENDPIYTTPLITRSSYVRSKAFNYNFYSIFLQLIQD